VAEVSDRRAGRRFTDELLEVGAELGRVAPVSGDDDLPLRVDDKLGVVAVAERVLELVVCGVGEPGPAGL